mgnify:CR=1 FL=1
MTDKSATPLTDRLLFDLAYVVTPEHDPRLARLTEHARTLEAGLRRLVAALLAHPSPDIHDAVAHARALLKEAK